MLGHFFFTDPSFGCFAEGSVATTPLGAGPGCIFSISALCLMVLCVASFSL